MEWIIPFLLGFLVLSAVMQLFWAYALSAIAEKGGQSELMRVLAWIPILQIAPWIVAGGGSIAGFLLGTIGLLCAALILGLTAAFIGGTVGTAIAGLGLASALLVSLVYFGRITCATAADRNLSSWVGLWVFVPIANFFIYPYIAFHDGWTSPNKIGLVIGLVLTIGSTVPSFESAQRMNQAGGLPIDFSAMMAGDLKPVNLTGFESFDDSIDASAGVDAKTGQSGNIATAESIRALYSMQGRFEKLRKLVEAPGLQRPEQRKQAKDLLRSIDVELETYRGRIDGPTFQQLAADLLNVEARIASAGSSRARPGGTVTATRTPRTRTKSNSAPGPGPAAFQSTQETNPAPIRPFPVSASEDCPQGTTLRSRVRDTGEEEWCQQLDERGGLRHGWYAHYGQNGKPESIGEYSNGLRIGIWTRFYSSGRVRAQAQFVEGLQHGWLLSFNEEGTRTRAVRFDRGAVVR